jgi:hypothetical protein
MNPPRWRVFVCLEVLIEVLQSSRPAILSIPQLTATVGRGSGIPSLTRTLWGRRMRYERHACRHRRESGSQPILAAALAAVDLPMLGREEVSPTFLLAVAIIVVGLGSLLRGGASLSQLKAPLGASLDPRSRSRRLFRWMVDHFPRWRHRHRARDSQSARRLLRAACRDRIDCLRPFLADPKHRRHAHAHPGPR